MITALIVIGSVIAYFLVGATLCGLTRRFVDDIELKVILTFAFIFVWPLAVPFCCAFLGCNWIATRIDDAITARAERRKARMAEQFIQDTFAKQRKEVFRERH